MEDKEKTKKIATLISGGKDSIYAAWLASKEPENELTCLISLESENQDSYMFHTPSISKVKKQAEVAELPLITERTAGEKEKELEDLKKAIKRAIKEYEIEGIVTGALASQYQRQRIEKICNDLGLESINPIWNKDETEYLKELKDFGFKVTITAVAAWPLDETWLGREIDDKFIQEVKELQEMYGIHPAGEGGEFETFVLDAPGDFFKRPLRVKNYKDSKEGENSSQREIEVE